jgi:hypothetical protein
MKSIGYKKKRLPAKKEFDCKKKRLTAKKSVEKSVCLQFFLCLQFCQKLTSRHSEL